MSLYARNLAQDLLLKHLATQAGSAGDCYGVSATLTVRARLFLRLSKLAGRLRRRRLEKFFAWRFVRAVRITWHYRTLWDN